MQVKDYYSTLGVPTSASQQEIKKAFRKLALQFHPDKNNGSHHANALFSEIQEAYEVLSDVKRREEYHYKRWYTRAVGQSYAQRALSPIDILAETRLIKNYVDSTSIFRINYDMISGHIRHLLTETSIGILQQHADPALNRNVVLNILSAIAPLPYRYQIPICHLLRQVTPAETGTTADIDKTLLKKKQQEHWDKYKWMVVVLLTALICWLMYIIAS